MNKRFWLFASVMLVACAGKPSSGDTAIVKAEPVLGIDDLKFFQADAFGMHLHRDGKFEFKVTGAGEPAKETWRSVGAVAADGTITNEGGSHGQLRADGMFIRADGQAAPFKLDGDSLAFEGKHATIDEKGVFVVDGKPTELRVEGSSDVMSKRTALLIIALMMGNAVHAQFTGDSTAQANQ